MKRKIFSKGYTVRVSSWENDGDYQAKHEITVDSLEEAKELKKLAELSESRHNSKSKLSLGNVMADDYEEYFSQIADEMKKFKHLEYLKDRELTDEYLVDVWMDYNTELLGSSEWYLSRVCENVEILYSPEDIYVEAVE